MDKADWAKRLACDACGRALLGIDGVLAWSAWYGTEWLCDTCLHWTWDLLSTQYLGGASEVYQRVRSEMGYPKRNVV